MASFDGKNIDDSRLDETYINELSDEEIVDLILEMLNAADDAESILFNSSYNDILNFLLDKDAKNMKNPSTTEKELPILNNMEEDSTVNKGKQEKMQIQFHSQWTESRGRNEDEINVKDKFHTDQVSSTSYQDLDVSNVKLNHDIPSVSNDAQNQVPAEEKESTYVRCTSCGILKSSRMVLNLHLASEHHIGNYKCETCNRVYAYKYQLDKHNIAHHTGIPSFSNDAQVLKSPEKGMNISSSTCTVCGVVLSSIHSLRSHNASQHRIGHYKCDACELVFAFPYQLNKHNNFFHNK